MKTLFSPRCCAALMAFAFALGPVARAASSIYTGVSSVNWNDVTNWQAGVLPADGDDVTIADSTAHNSVTLNDGPHTIGTLQMGTTGTRANSAQAVFTINGNTTAAGAYPLTLTNGVVANGNFSVSGTAGLQIKTPVIIQGDQTWSIGGNVGSSTADYGVQLTVGANGTQRPLTLNGTLIKTGPGQLNWVGQNVGDGNVVINQGSLKFNAGSSTTLTVGGAGAITVNSGGSLFISRNSGTLAITKALVFNDGSTLRLGGNNSGLNTVGSPFTFNGTVPILLEYSSLLLNLTNNWSGTLNSTITGSGGTATFWGDNSALAGAINNNGTFVMRFGSAKSSSAAVAWALNNAAAYFDIYGSNTNLDFGSLAGTAGTVRNNNTNGQPATVTVGALNTSTTFGGVLSDSTGQLGLVKVGTGTLTLGGANTYSADTIINNGTLLLQGTGATISGNVTVNSGATFGGNGTVYGTATVASGSAIESDGGIGATQPLTLGSLTLGADGSSQTTTKVNVYLSGAITTSSLTVNGMNVIDIIGAAPAVGVYNLISYGGSIGGAGFAGFKLGDLPYGVVATLQDSGTAVQLNVTAITAEASVWTGNATGSWDLDGTLDWKGVTSGNPQAYHDLYPVFFDDSAANFTVNLTTNVLPAAVNVNNPTHDYTLTGAGSIVGTAALTKDGGGAFIIANNNNYSGGTFVTNGVLQLGNGGTNGWISGPIASDGGVAFDRSDAPVFAGVISGAGSVEQKGSGVLTLSGNNTYMGVTTVSAGTLATGTGTALGDPGTGTVVADGATLDVHAQNLGIEPVSVQGAGVAGAGAIINSSADNQNALRYVTLNGPTTFGGSFRWDIRDPTPAAGSSGINASLTGNGNTLTKVGTNTIAFINIGDLGLADINIMGGTLTISRSTTPGNPANTITVYPGATLQFHRTSEFMDNVINKVLVVTNGTLAVESNGLTNWFSGAVTLSGANSVTLPAATGLVLEGPVGGDGSFIANSSGGLFALAGNCTYTGGTIINGGVFQVDGTVGTGVNPLLLTNAILSGIGTIKDPVTVPAGSTLAPGDAGIGTLTVNNTLALAPGSTSSFEINKDYPTNDMALVSGSVAYSGTLVLTNVGFTPFAPGDSFKLFNAAGYSGAFASIVPATPGTGLLWDTNSLTVNGTVKVIVLPTPNPPVVLAADSLVANSVNVIFNMPVDPNTSQNPANYQLNTPNVIYAATQISPTNIQLSLDSVLTVSNYTLQVQGVQNLSYVPDTIVTTNVPGKTFGFDAATAVIIDPANGQAFALGDKIHIFASGADIFGTSDQFEYVYKNFTNDFDVSVCLESEGQSDPAAKAGLMVREINDPSGPGPADRMVMVASFPPDPGRAQNLFEYREDTFGTAVSPTDNRPGSTFPNNWLRLVRTGSMFSTYFSSNNADWVFMGSVDSSTNAAGAYAANVWVGLAVTSHNASLVNEAVFSNFGTTQSAPAPAEISIGQSGGNLVLSWPASSVGFTLQATPSLTPPVTWTNVPDTSGTNTIQIPIGSGTSFFRLVH